MKAMILERKGEYAAALRADGTVVRTRQAGEVGEEIELEAELVRFPVRKRLMRTAVAAVAAVMILGGSSVYVFAMPAEYVSLDAGESSVELAVNRVGRVISVKPTSEGDRAIAETLNTEVRGKRVEDALAQTMTVFREEGYLEGEDAAIIAGVTAASERRGAELTEALESAATRNGEGVPLYTLDVTPAERGEARSQEMSGGRYVFERGGKPEHEPPPTEPMLPQGSDTPAETSEPDASEPPASSSPAPSEIPAATESETRPQPPDNETDPAPTPVQAAVPDGMNPTEPPETEQEPDDAPPTEGGPTDNGAGASGESAEQPPPAPGETDAGDRSEPDFSGEQAPGINAADEAPEESNGNAGSRPGAEPGQGITEKAVWS